VVTRHFFCSLILILFAFANFASADISIYKIRPETKKIIITQSGDSILQAGDTVAVTSQDGEECSIAIQKTVKNLALGDASSCAFFEELQLGQKLKIAGQKSTHGKISGTESLHNEIRHRFGGHLFYNFANSIDSSLNVTGEHIPISDKGSGAIGFGVRYEMQFPEDFGLMAAFNYEMPRQFTHRDYGGSYSIYSTDNTQAPSLSLAYLELNVNYVWNSIIGFGGINYPFASFSGKVGPTGFTSNLSLTGGLGFQVGAGYKFNEILSAELGYRILNFMISEDTSASILNYDYSRLWGFFVRGVFLF
jgi:hypothetical protein